MKATAHAYGNAGRYFALLWSQVERDAGVSAQLLARRILADVPPDVPDDVLPLCLAAGLRDLVRYVPERGQVVASLPRLIELGGGDCNDLAPALASMLIACGWEPAFMLGWTRKPNGWLGAHLWIVLPDGRELDASTYDLAPGERPSSRYERVTTHRRPE